MVKDDEEIEESYQFYSICQIIQLHIVVGLFLYLHRLNYEIKFLKLYCQILNI